MLYLRRILRIDSSEVVNKGICNAVLAAVLIFTCFCVMWKANWVFTLFAPNDECQILTTTAIGRPSHAWTGNGRFWPLGLCDYCILLFLPFGNTATAHCLYNCIMMILASLMLYRFLNKICQRHCISLFSLLILFSISTFMHIHSVFIYSERMMFFMLSAFMLLTQKGQEKQSSSYYFLAFLAAAYATYLKEPVFGVFIIIATVNIIFGKLSFKDKIFNGALLANAAIFVAIYAYRMAFRDFGEPYAKITFNPFEMSFAPFLKEPILILMMIIACIRAYSILLKKDRRHVFTDSLLFAGIGYLIAIMMLRFTDPYYFFPSVLLFIPAFAIFLLNRNGSCRDLNETSISLKSKRCNIICSCFAAMCMIITVMKSSDAMQKCWESRNNDHLFFEHIATESKAGKTVYVIFNDSGINRGRETLSSPHIAFLRYYCQKFHIVTDVDPLKISENSIVLFYSISPFKEQSQAFIIKKLEKNGFKIIRTLGDLKLYGKKV